MVLEPYPKLRTPSKRSENDGHQESSNLTFTYTSERLAGKTKQILSSETMIYYSSVIITLIPPFCLSNLSDWIYFTNCSFCRRTPMPTLHSFSKKESPQALFLYCKLSAFRIQTQTIKKNWPSDSSQQLVQCEHQSNNYTLPHTTRSWKPFCRKDPGYRYTERRWPKGIALGTRDWFWTPQSVARIGVATYLKNNAYQIADMYPTTSCLHAHHSKKGASIAIKAARKRMLIKEKERGALLSQVENKTYA